MIEDLVSADLYIGVPTSDVSEIGAVMLLRDGSGTMEEVEVSSEGIRRIPVTDDTSLMGYPVVTDLSEVVRVLASYNIVFRRSKLTELGLRYGHYRFEDAVEVGDHVAVLSSHIEGDGRRVYRITTLYSEYPEFIFTEYEDGPQRLYHEGKRLVDVDVEDFAATVLDAYWKRRSGQLVDLWKAVHAQEVE